MIYIPFPQIRFDSHTALTEWRGISNHDSRKWSDLKPYLKCQVLLPQASLSIIGSEDCKCWYSEMYQSDPYAQDVDHFRPKDRALPLNQKTIQEIEALYAVSVFQSSSILADGYHWLKYDYRNYRFTTANANRRKKRDFFPIAPNTTRLSVNQEPWNSNTPEYPLLLDPTDFADHNLLIVLPDGMIMPILSPQSLTEEERENPPLYWRRPGFNYLRAAISIVLYDLNHTNLIERRKKHFALITHKISDWIDWYKSQNKRGIYSTTSYLINSIQPHAEFSLTARSAMQAYTCSPQNVAYGTLVRNFIQILIMKVDNQLSNSVLTQDWNRS